MGHKQERLYFITKSIDLKYEKGLAMIGFILLGFAIICILLAYFTDTKVLLNYLNKKGYPMNHTKFLDKVFDLYIWLGGLQ